MKFIELTYLFSYLGVGNNTEPVPKVVLLQVLLGQVLQIPLGKGNVRGNNDLGLLPLQLDVGSHVGGLAINLIYIIFIYVKFNLPVFLYSPIGKGGSRENLRIHKAKT